MSQKRQDLLEAALLAAELANTVGVPSTLEEVDTKLADVAKILGAIDGAWPKLPDVERALWAGTRTAVLEVRAFYRAWRSRLIEHANEGDAGRA